MPKVIATQRGYYGGRLIEADQAFTIDTEKDFSDVWMERLSKKADASSPAKDLDSQIPPKKFKLMPKFFKDERQNRQVDAVNAWEGAYVAWLKADSKRTVDDWNALRDEDRKALVTKHAERMLAAAPA